MIREIVACLYGFNSRRTTQRTAPELTRPRGSANFSLQKLHAKTRSRRSGPTISARHESLNSASKMIVVFDCINCVFIQSELEVSNLYFYFVGIRYFRKFISCQGNAIR